MIGEGRAVARVLDAIRESRTEADNAASVAADIELVRMPNARISVERHRARLTDAEKRVDDLADEAREYEAQIVAEGVIQAGLAALLVAVGLDELDGTEAIEDRIAAIRKSAEDDSRVVDVEAAEGDDEIFSCAWCKRQHSGVACSPRGNTLAEF